MSGLRLKDNLVTIAAAGAPVLFVAIGLASGVACGLVDAGPETGPPAGCNARADFFISDMWPKYYETYMCGKSDCHDASTGHGYFRLQSVTGLPVPLPTDPVSSWPMPWVQNLLAVRNQVSCSNPLTSPSLAIPEGNSIPHPPGNIVLDHPGAEALFMMWAALSR